MGKSGDYRVRYRVEIRQLKRQLQQVESLLKAHGGRVGARPTASVGARTLNTAELASLKEYNVSQKLVTEANKERRLSEQAVAKATERQRRATERAANTARKGSKDFRLLGQSLKRMLLFFSSAALLLGAKKLAANIADIAGSFQFLVRELTVLGEEGEEIYAKLALAGFDAAISTGRSFNEAADAMKGWIRQGFSAVEIADLTRTTLIGLNLTQISSIELVRTMTAQMKAYNIPAADSITIIDKLVGVSRKYAIETGQLAIGMRRFAAVSSEAGLSLEQQAGLMTAMMERTQQAAQMVGRAGRTILTRMRRNAVETIEEIGKVDVFTDESRQSFRDMWTVLGELAGKWDSYTEAERAALAFQAGGLRQQEFFIALMKDFKTAQEASIVALESAGLAYRSNEILVNSFNKALAGLRNTWDQLLARQTGILDFFTSIVHGLTSLIQVAATVPQYLVAITAGLVGVAGIVTLLATGGASIVGWVLALAGAFATLAWALGQGSTGSLDRMIAKAKELTQGRLHEAQSIEKLTAEYIRLFEQYKEGAETGDLLVRTRQALDKLNPSLLSGEQDLEKIYETLTGKVIELREATQELLRVRTQEQELTLEIQRANAQTDIRTSRERLTTKQRHLEFADPQEVKETARIIEDELHDAYIELERLRTLYNVTDRKFSKDEQALLDSYSEKLQKHTATIKRERAADRFSPIGTGLIFGQRQLKDAELLVQAHDRVVKSRAREIDQLKAENQAVLDLAKAYRLKESIEARLAALQPKFGPFPAVEREASAILVRPETKKALDEEIRLLEAKIQLEFVLDNLFKGRAKLQGAATILQIKQFGLVKAHLQAVADNNVGLEKGQAALDKLVEFEREGLEFTELRIQAAQAVLDIWRLSQQLREKQDKEEAREFKRKFDEELKLEKLKSTNAEKSIQKELDISKARVGAFQTSLRAAQFEWAEREELLNREKAKLDELGPARGLDPVKDARIANQTKVVDRAREKEEEAFGKVQIEILRERVDLEKALLAEKELIKDIELAAIAAGSGEIAAGRAKVALLKTELADRQAGLSTNETDATVQEKKNELTKAEADLAAKILDHGKKVTAATKELNDLKFEASVDQIRFTEGEAAALDEILAKRKEELEIAKARNEDGLHWLELLAAMLGVQIAINNIGKNDRSDEDKNRKEREKIAQEMRDLEFDHAVSMETIEHGRLAGLKLGLALIQESNRELEVEQQTLGGFKLGQQLLKLSGAKVSLLEIEEKIAENLLKLEKGRVDEKRLGTAVTQEEIQIVKELQSQAVSFIAQQAAALIGGDFSEGGAVTGLAGLVSSYVRQIDPLLGTVIAGIGTVLGAVFQDPADNLSDSMNRQTEATLKLEQTLSDIQQQQIGVPTSFVLPAAITMGGALRGGVNTTVQQNNTITVVAGDRDTQQVGAEIYDYLEARASVDDRRGFPPNQF